MKITPDKPIWLSGYAVRNRPSEGVLQDLWAKALAIQDGRGGTVVIVTTDLIGLTRNVSDVVAARVQKEYGLERSRLLLNSSHTHTGPIIRSNLKTMFALNAEDTRTVEEYAAKLIDSLVAVTGAALGKLEPARVSYASGEARFAINRRAFNSEKVRVVADRPAPVDHSVPVLKVTKPNGELLAVLAGYACHNTTLTGEFYRISGDYAGFAQSELETAYPGATAMFLMLCGADQNPAPRSRVEHAVAHGKELAGAARKALEGVQAPVEGRLRTSFHITEAALAPHSRGMFEQMRNDTNIAKRLLAENMLKAYDDRRPVQSIPYPVQAIRFGDDLTILALGGEVVVDYALRAKREFPRHRLIVAGYSNDVMCYIPTRRILKEGGYEAESSMWYYGVPAPFTEAIEETVFDAIRTALKRVGVSR